MVQVIHPTVTQSQTPTLYAPQPLPRQPGTLETILDRLGGGLAGGIEQGIANSMQSQMRRAVLDKALGMINPNMSALERAQVLTSVDPETQKVLQGVFEQEDKQRQAQGLMQALQGITGEGPIAQPGLPGQRNQAQALAGAGLSPNEAIQVARIQQQQRQAEKKLTQQEKNLHFSETKDYRNELLKAYKGAKKSESILNKLDELNEKEDLTPASLYKLTEKLGIPLSVVSNPASEKFNKLSQTLLQGISQIYPGQIRVAEIDNFLRTIPTLENSKEGRREIVKDMKFLLSPALQEYEIYRQIMKEQPKGVPPIDLQDQVQERMDALRDEFLEKYGSSEPQSALLQPQQGQTIRLIKNGVPYNIPAQFAEQALQNGFTR